MPVLIHLKQGALARILPVDRAGFLL